MGVVIRKLINHIFGFDFQKLSVSEESGPQGGPGGMNDFHLWYVSTSLSDDLLEDTILIGEHFLHAWRSIKNRWY